MFIIAGVLLFASRLPWLSAGYGAMQDSYRVFNAARGISESGTYVLSRPPGHPVHDYLVSMLVPVGPVGSNMLTALFSLVAFGFFALILRRVHIRNYLMGALGFAFTPVVYINSTCTIDYVVAVAFVLAATYFVLSHRFIAAGICLGLAVGVRITSGAMLAPFIAWSMLGAKSYAFDRRCFYLVIGTLAVASICYLPVISEYGLSVLTFYDHSYPPLWSVLLEGTLRVWGFPGMLALVGLICAAPIYINAIKLRLSQEHVLPLLALCTVSIALYLIAFVRLPDASGYLIPIIPFVIMMVGLFAPGHIFRLFALALLLSSFIGVNRNGIPVEGPIFQDHYWREASQHRTSKIIAAVDQLPGTAVIVAGWELPAIEARLGSEYQKQHRYVYLIEDESSCARYVMNARQIYYLSKIDTFNQLTYGVDLRKCEAQELQLTGQ